MIECEKGKKRRRIAGRPGWEASGKGIFGYWVK